MNILSYWCALHSSLNWEQNELWLKQFHFVACTAIFPDKIYRHGVRTATAKNITGE